MNIASKNHRKDDQIRIRISKDKKDKLKQRIKGTPISVFLHSIIDEVLANEDNYKEKVK